MANDLNKIQEKNESQQNRDLWWILLPGRRRSCRLQLQWAQGRNITEVKIPGVQLLRKRSDRDDLISAWTNWKLPSTNTMTNLWKASLKQATQKWDDDRAWFSRVDNWHWDIRAIGATWKNLLEKIRIVRLDFSLDEVRLDGTAQSVSNEETLRDRSERPDDINSQEHANTQNFIVGNDETELELSEESRSFVNRVTDQVRKRQKRISNVTDNGENILWFGECSRL